VKKFTRVLAMEVCFFLLSIALRLCGDGGRVIEPTGGGFEEAFASFERTALIYFYT